jgi:hypothetical protein
MQAYRISFKGEAEAGLKRYDQVNTTLYAYSNPYAALHFAVALHGENLKSMVTDLKRVKDEQTQKVSYDLTLSEPLPENVLQLASNYLDIVPLSE